MTETHGRTPFTPTLQASSLNELEVTVPSEAMVTGSIYAFALRVDSTLGGFSKAGLEVFKSPEVLLMSKVGKGRRLPAARDTPGGVSPPREMEREASIPSHVKIFQRFSTVTIPLRFDISLDLQPNLLRCRNITNGLLNPTDALGGSSHSRFWGRQ